MQQVQRPQRPRSAEMVLQSIFVCEPVNAAGGRLLTGASYRQELLSATLGAFAPGSAKDTVSVLPQHLESAVVATIGGLIHVSRSSARPDSIERMFCRLTTGRDSQQQDRFRLRCSGSNVAIIASRL